MKGRSFSSGLSRSRWAAIGAAVSVSLGAGGVAWLHAADSQPSVFHAVSPVRMFDTRFGTGGVPVAPLGPDSTLDVTFAGIDGVPGNATALVLNVTVVDGTASSFLTVWPTGDERPLASSLNWTGSAATPNGVTVPIGVGGKVSFYNLKGTVNVLADVTGYYTASLAPPFTNAVAQSLAGSTLPTDLSSIASATLTLPDVCPGLDSWSVIASADGYFQLSPSTLPDGANATIGLGLAPTVVAQGTIVNQSFVGTPNWLEPYATSFLFTVDSGVQTFYELGSATPVADVSVGHNNLLAQSVAVHC